MGTSSAGVERVAHTWMASHDSGVARHRDSSNDPRAGARYDRGDCAPNRWGAIGATRGSDQRRGGRFVDAPDDESA